MPATKLAGNTKKTKQCTKGYSCGFSCIAKNRDCSNPLDGQAKNYADWLAKASTSASNPQKLTNSMSAKSFGEPADFAQVDREIEILRTGTYTSNSGVSMTFKRGDLEEIASTYNPANFKAPLIISHDTKGLSDKELGNSEFAFGAPKALKVVGDRLKAVFDHIAPEFVQWVRDKKLLSISPSIYLPTSPSNPTPGRLSLRHIAALGKSPPAIKGMEPLSLTELAFGEVEEGVLCFSQAIDPVVGALQQNDDYPNRAIDNLMERVARLEALNPSNPTYTEPMTTDFEARERQLAEREQAILRKELASFCETELRGRLIPAIAPTTEVVEFMAFLAGQEGELDFSEDKQQSALAWFQGFLKRLPKQVEFREVIPSGDFNEIPEEDAVDRAAREAYANAWKNTWKGGN